MNADRSSEGLQEIATRFSALWRALSHDGDAPRKPDETRMLVDRVRDALDRRQAHLEDSDTTFVANSFLLEELVHDGSPTQIHRIRHRDLQTLHALKTIGPDHADNAVAQDMLLREARLTIALKHKHIVTAHVTLRLPDGRPALVLEWMPGSLSDRMNAGPFSPRDIRHAMTAILSGLEAVHVAGLVHADISPDNLLLAGNELTDMKIADFGIALETGQRHADLGLAMAGHTEFSAPEHAEGKMLDGRSDLYSCGRIVMLLLARCSSLGNAADQLRGLAHHLTRHDPDDRPESASAALRLLNTIEL